MRKEYNGIYAYTSADGNAATHNNYRSGGNLTIKSGTVNAKGNGTGTVRYVAGIGDSYYGEFGNVTIEGGKATVDNSHANGAGISGDEIEISGGVVEDLTGGTKGGIHAQASFTMSGGTINGSAVLRTADNVTISITGGNVNGYYDAAITDRTLTKLYFVEADGTPKANTEVTVKEGADGTEWTALTDENGVVTTYFASSATSITAGVGSETGTSVTSALPVCPRSTRPSKRSFAAQSRHFKPTSSASTAKPRTRICSSQQSANTPAPES